MRFGHEFYPFWCDGTSSRGGCGLIVKNSFLQNFNPVVLDRDWIHIVPGHLAVLRLSGPKGALHIFSVYLPTGTSGDDSVRQNVIRKLGGHMFHPHQALSVVCGDFNLSLIHI